MPASSALAFHVGILPYRPHVNTLCNNLQGRITPAELYTFFKEIHIMWVNVLGEYADLSIFDVVDELIDMVGGCRAGRCS